jgi:hypothetical protein
MSSSLIRQDLGPMVVGYLLVMGSLAIGLRIVQRPGKAKAASAAGADKPATADNTAEATSATEADGLAAADQKARAGQVASRAAATGAAGGADNVQAGRPPATAGQVTGAGWLRALAPDPGWRRLAIFSLSTAVGGYLLLMAVIIGYYFGISPVAGNFVHSAFSGCAMLIGLAAPVFIALSWLAERKGWRI